MAFKAASVPDRNRQRQDMIQQFLDQPFLLSSVRETLGNIRDVERTVGRLSQLSGNARDVVRLRFRCNIAGTKGHLTPRESGAGGRRRSVIEPDRFGNP